MTKTKLKLGLTAAVLVAGVAVPVWQQARIKQQAAEIQRLRAQVAEMPQLRMRAAEIPELEAKVTQLQRNGTNSTEPELLRAANAELQREVIQLRGRVSTATAQTTATKQALAQAESNAMPAGLNAVMRSAMEKAVEQQTLGKLPRLKERLNLNPAQEEAVRGILTRQMEEATEMATKTLSGKLTAEELQNSGKARRNPEEEIKALLTPEQQVAYQEYKQEEASANARLVANAELLQMQTTVGLTEEQQDRAFQALYDHSLNQLSGKFTNAPPQSADIAGAMQWMAEQKIKALEGVLTPEQLRRYREVQESQAKMVSGFLPQPKAAARP